MSDPSINHPEWDIVKAEAPFRWRAMRLGAHAGAEELGVTLYEIDPGGAISPYHVHHGNEELLLVLSGTPQLRTPDGGRTLRAGATVAFRRGSAGAHRVSNGGAEPARMLIFSTMNLPEVAEYPDTGTWLAMTGPGEIKAFPAGADPPYMETLVRAMQAAAQREGDGDAGAD
jgi:uncharacterized cupin superfamily protein